MLSPRLVALLAIGALMALESWFPHATGWRISCLEAALFSIMLYSAFA